MITRVQIKNYRSIAEADVSLEPMTVLVGRNGSGKSSFIDAIKLVRDALQTGLENALATRNGFYSIRRWSPGRNLQVEISLSVETFEFEGHYEITLAGDGEDVQVQHERGRYRVWYEEMLPGGKTVSREDEHQFERRGTQWVTYPDLELNSGGFDAEPLEPTALALPALAVFGGFAQLRRLLSGNFYTIFPNTLRQPQKPLAKRVMSDQGDNFVSVLQHIIAHEEQKREIVSVLSRVVEGVSDVRVRAAGHFLVAELKHADIIGQASGNGEPGGPWFDLSQESDGTLRMLGLLTALYRRPTLVGGPALLAVEEPEMALHPGALAILAEELHTAARRRQILVTTQSPDLIARIPAEQLRVVERYEGVTTISPLEETQRQVIEDQLFNAGDLLRIEGLRGSVPLAP